MIRLTILLCAVLYVGMVLVPELSTPGPGVAGRAGFDPTSVSGEPAPVPQQVPTTAPTRSPAAPVTITLPTGEVLEVAAVLRPSQVQAEVVRLNAPPAPPAPEPAAQGGVAVQDTPTGSEEVVLLYVTGSRVNLRAGPSTGNEIIAALGFGAQVELLSDPGNGWLEIRETEGGRVGFMSGRFLSPDRP